MDDKYKDFIFSFVLIAVGLFVLFGGISIYKDAAQMPYSIPEFVLSPGFMPVILGAALLFCSILLLFQSLKGRGTLKAAFIDNWNRFSSRMKPAFSEYDTISMAVGIAMMFVYSFFLIKLLPFWVASLIFLVGLMLFLKAAKWWKVVIIALAVIGLTVLLFQIGFHAALP
ncbi:tripartite tricarboxylate transporter TctB family protein [Treponema sp. OMZ 840]|uniref:tripartite tricarboxylate transporter TctB family protein n=1 Tax=Treponema sp. OMZ 840 TaxID=244313 RepID=UPI003D922EEF